MDDYYDNDTLTNYFLQLANGMKSVNSILVHRDKDKFSLRIIASHLYLGFRAKS